MLVECLAAIIVGWNYDKLFLYYKKKKTKQQIQKEFDNVFYALRILDEEQKEKVYFRHTLGNSNYIEFAFSLDENVTVSRFQARLEDIKAKLCLDNLEIEAYNRLMYFTIRNKNRKPIPFRLHQLKENLIPLGYNDFNSLVTWDISVDAHMLIGGSTGGGKSTLIRSIIFHLVVNTKSELMLVDLKSGLEFSPLKNLNNVTAYGENVNEAIQIIEAVHIECDKRLKLLNKSACKDIKAYNSNNRKKKLSRLFLVVDEFADLAYIKKKKDEVHPLDLLIELSRKSRAVGIHLILATQRPSAKVLSGELKSNFTALIGLRTNDITNSRVIIDTSGLEELNIGESITILGGNQTKFRSMLLEGEQLKELILQNSKSSESAAPNRLESYMLNASYTTCTNNNNGASSSDSDTIYVAGEMRVSKNSSVMSVEQQKLFFDMYGLDYNEKGELL